MSPRTELKLYFWSRRPLPIVLLRLSPAWANVCMHGVILCWCVGVWACMYLTFLFVSVRVCANVFSDVCVSTCVCVSHANGAPSPAPRPEVMGGYTQLPLPGSDEYSQQHAPLP